MVYLWDILPQSDCPGSASTMREIGFSLTCLQEEEQEYILLTTPRFIPRWVGFQDVVVKCYRSDAYGNGRNMVARYRS